jgi:hypothetical protein
LNGDTQSFGPFGYLLKQRQALLSNFIFLLNKFIIINFCSVSAGQLCRLGELILMDSTLLYDCPVELNVFNFRIAALVWSVWNAMLFRRVLALGIKSEALSFGGCFYSDLSKSEVWCLARYRCVCE